MKASRSRKFALVLLFVFILASSLPAVQKALGGSQADAWANARFLPLVMYDVISVPTTTPTLTPTVTASSTPTETQIPVSPTIPLPPTSTDTLTFTATPSDTPTPSATLTYTSTPSATPTLTNTPTATATPTESPTPSATPICHLPSPTPTCTSTSTQSCTPPPIHTAIFTPTGSTITAMKLTVTQSPLAIYPPIMIYTAQMMVMIPISFTGVKVDFYNLQETGLEYLGSAEIKNTSEAVLSKQMCPGKYTAIARAEVNSLVIWSNLETYTVH